MNVQFHKHFLKQYKKHRALHQQIDERLALFRVEPFHPRLNNHALQGKYNGCRSINITGDYRAIFEFIDNNTVRFIDLDTHSNLYQ